MVSMSTNVATRAALVACFIPLMVACGAAGESTEEGAAIAADAPESEDFVSAIRQPVEATPYSFEISFDTSATNGQPRFLAPSGFVCLLSGVSGNWNVNTEAYVFVQFNEWYARGRGRAICTQGLAFPNGSASGWMHMLSSDQKAQMRPDGWVPGLFSPSLCPATDGGKNYGCNKHLWFGDAFTFLNKVNGRLNALDAPGHGDGVFVIQGPTGVTNSQLHVRNQTVFLEGSALSFFVGVAGQGRLVRLRGYDANNAQANGYVNSAGRFEFRVSVSSGFGSFWVARADLSMCGLTAVSGNYDGGAEVKITEQTNPDGRPYWVLSANAPVWGGESARGAARCMAFDQR